ncbi:Fimbrial assembly protein, serogroup I [Nymphon striatum]|nr:Fimbrial assembly protein, serogroup I [Nymphon striatum]
MFKDKIKATVIHLLLSILLVGLVIGSILFFFFPKLFIGISDFKEVATIIITVDLILGPLLTFVVFQPNKKSLKFDLSVIASIQLAALIYGAYSLYQVHPVYITFNIDRFTMISAKDAEPEKAQYDEFKVSKLTTAKLAYAKMPDDAVKRNEVTLTAAMGGGDLDQRVEYYEPYKENINQVLAKSIDKKIILKAASTDKKINLFIEKYGSNLDNYAFLPLNSNKKEAIIVLDKESANPVATINSDPFQVIALLFGMFSIYQKHPVYAVFAVDRFTLINASFAEPEKTIHKELKTTFLSKSKMAFARLPTDSKLRKEITMGHMLKGEPDIDGRAEFYEPYLNHTDKVISQSLNIKGMVKKTDEKNEIERFLNQYGGDIDTYAYIPLQTNKEDVIWVLNKLTAEPIGILKIDPWQFSKSQESKKKEKNKTRRWLS